MSETTTTQRRSINAAAFASTFDRIVTPGRTISMRAKARMLGLPASSLGHMLKGNRPPSAELVLGLVRLGFTDEDFDAVLGNAGPSPASKAA